MPLFGRIHGPAAARRMTGRPGNVRAPGVYRLARAVARRAGLADPLARTPVLALVEAALMLADGPLSAGDLAAAAGVTAAEAGRLIEQLGALLDRDDTAFHVVPVAGGFQLLARPAYHPWLARARRAGPDLRLGPALMETLAVVAYRQPVTRADVEAVRGAGAGESLRVLAERGLIRPAGRHASLGRPQQYATTRRFLQAFGLATLADLPAVEPAPAMPTAPPVSRVPAVVA